MQFYTFECFLGSRHFGLLLCASTILSMDPTTVLQVTPCPEQSHLAASPLVVTGSLTHPLTPAFLLPQLEGELEVCETESGELQEYANVVLQQIADYCPDILEQVVNALEESC